jgi:GNAT superfamily N-acetyltransferase
MSQAVQIRPLRRADRAAWEPLWAGYNAFYGRSGDTALPEAISEATWERCFDPAEPVHALVAEAPAHVGRGGAGALLGLVHYLYHRSTTRIEPVCYLQDLYTAEAARGQGIGRALIEAVYAASRAAGVHRVYWHTQAGNAVARRLYEQVAAHAGVIVYTHDA